MAVDSKYGVIAAEKKTFHTDEPVFVLRATDALAPAAIEVYAVLCAQKNCGAEHVEAARQCAIQIRRWQEANPKLVKLPD